jgi:hypothetical protein
VKTEKGEVRIRVESSFYAVTESGQTIDGPFDNISDAVEAAKEVDR